MFDDNNSSELDFDEFSAVLHCISNTFKKNTIEKLFKQFDVSKDGKISK